MPRKITYAQMREMGLCTACGKQNPTPERKTCPKCTEKRNEQRREARQYHIRIGYCTRCGKRKAEPNRHMCLECLWKDRDYYQERDKERLRERDKKRSIEARNNGMCVSCKKQKATKGVYCTRCYRRQILYRERRRNDISRSEYVAYGRCYICGEKAIEGKGVCEKCYETRLRTIKIASSASVRSDNNYFRKLNNAMWSDFKERKSG